MGNRVPLSWSIDLRMASQRYFFRLFQSEKGHFMLWGLAVAALVSFTIAALSIAISSTQEVSRQPRIHSALSRAELQLRNFLSQPTSFTGCPQNCRIDDEALKAIKLPVLPWCRGNENKCKIEVRTNQVVNGKASIVLQYIDDTKKTTGVLSMKSVDVDLPSNVTDFNPHICRDPNRPIMTGFDKNNNAICTEIKVVDGNLRDLIAKPCARAGGVCCPDGYYAAGFTSNPLRLVCGSLQPSLRIGCFDSGSGQCASAITVDTTGSLRPMSQCKLTSMKWGASVEEIQRNATCGSRVDPFVIFQPSLRPIPAVQL